MAGEAATVCCRSVIVARAREVQIRGQREAQTGLEFEYAIVDSDALW